MAKGNTLTFDLSQDLLLVKFFILLPLSLSKPLQTTQVFFTTTN
ncbi:hypothetical protein THIOSC15_2500004 [uncultured Thiomicrorhabdus sp.]